MARLRLTPQKREFFSLYTQASANAVEIARLLVQLLERFPEDGGLVKQIKDREHEGDRLTHEVVDLPPDLTARLALSEVVSPLRLRGAAAPQGRIQRQVRDQLGTILCGAASANACEQVDTGGYQVTTTLDWSMQQTVEKWLEAAGRGPDQEEPGAPLALVLPQLLPRAPPVARPPAPEVLVDRVPVEP